MDVLRSQEPALAAKQSVEMPASYGRSLPISEEEIAAINVSDPANQAVVYIKLFFLQLGGAR